ncbi:hypothetical protein [Pseudomonas sp. B11(2017)]|uniref:hypothetical protein n=1 Tax=Pseudomonas sp. B11(2017) TaxID=1981748 RepID=UPI000A1E4599|nr:hypothetical protein [Pseudomonas sp. B11(2017)]
MLNVIGIRDGESRFLADPPISQDKLSRLVALDWYAGEAVLQPLILRKELLRLGSQRNVESRVTSREAESSSR